MKILLLGKNGQIGWELQRSLAPLGKVIALGQKELNLIDSRAIRSNVRLIKPDLIVNSAAYTAVDKAEEEADLAMIINGIAPGILAEEASLCKAAIIHFSTDYVFDGTKDTPYTEQDTPNPINIYGKTKLEGERAIQETGVLHLIFRISWIYGLRGNNFLLTILRLMQERDKLRIVNDQVGSPTWCRMIAELIAQVIAQNALQLDNQGVYHLSAAGETSWYGFAEEITKQVDKKIEKYPILQAMSANDFPSKAKRPRNSLLKNVLVKERFGLSLPDWQCSLKLALDDLNK